MKRIALLFIILISCNKEKDVFSETYEVKNVLNINRVFEKMR
jgi:hypothetical protein